MKNLYNKLSLFSVLALVAFESQNLQATSHNPGIEELQDSQKSQKSLTPQFRDLIQDTLQKIKDGRHLSKRFLKAFSKSFLGWEYLEKNNFMEELEIFDSMITPDDNLFDSWITLISHCSEGNPNFNRSLKVAKERGESEQATPVAQYNLGLMYFFGHGVNQDILKAVEFYQKAADREHAGAKYELAGIYKRGEGVVEEDITKAVDLYQKAADQGHAAAQYELGFIYKEGKGINQDGLQAIKWFLESAKNHHSGIKNALGSSIRFSFSTIKPEDEIDLGQNQNILKDNIERLLGRHVLEAEINNPDLPFREHKLAISSLLVPYRRIVALEETLLKTIKALNQPGFMVTFFQTDYKPVMSYQLSLCNYEILKNFKSSRCPDIKYHELKKDKVSFTFGQENIKVADEIMDVFSLYRPVDHDISFIKSILIKIQKNLISGNQLTDMSKQLMTQYKTRLKSSAEKQTWDMIQISPDYDPLLEKVEEEIKMLEELPVMCQQLQDLLIKGARVRNKLFLEKNKYIEDIFKD